MVHRDSTFLLLFSFFEEYCGHTEHPNPPEKDGVRDSDLEEVTESQNI